MGKDANVKSLRRFLRRSPDTVKFFVANPDTANREMRRALCVVGARASYWLSRVRYRVYGFVKPGQNVEWRLFKAVPR